MKTKLLTIAFILFIPFLIKGQPVDLLLNTPETGTQNHYASNSITFNSGYTYLPLTGTMIAAIVKPYVDGSVPYNYSIVDPATRVINTSYLVGTTNGSFNVNPMGAATYSIPIDVPPGVNGLNPNIALVYSSMGGPGVAGYGWQISGISAITRTSQTFYQDGQSFGVNLDSNDRFALDGQRLVATSGTYGSDGSQYRTENDIFTRVTAIGVSGSGPARFRTETKSGNIFEYGNTPDAVQKLTGITSAISWYVNSVSDLFGNKINYTYLNQDGAVYPAIIDYGPNRISFYYKARTDATNSYFKGLKIQQNLLLDKVEVSYNSAILKTYQFNYNYLANNYYGQSVLNEIVEYGTGGSFNSTAFTNQQPGNVDFSYTNYETITSENPILYSGDFNGDGKDDIFTVSRPELKNWKLFLANDQGGFTLSASGSCNFTIDKAIPTDLNGDGKYDLILASLKRDEDGSNNANYYYYSAISTGNSFATPSLFLSGIKTYLKQLSNYESFTDLPSCIDLCSFSADLDGDGINDFLVKKNDRSEGNEWLVYSMSPANLNFGMQLKYSLSIGGCYDRINLGDFNGDGKTDIWDILRFGNGVGLQIYTVNGNSLNTLYSAAWPTINQIFQLGDFNGDGKTDIFLYGTLNNSEWADWRIDLSTGTGFETHTFPAKKPYLDNDKVYIRDFNGDGRADIMALCDNTNYSPQYYFIADLNGDNFSSEYKSHPYFKKQYDYTFGDYNGDGKTDILVNAGYNYNDSRIYYTTGTTNILMKSIGDGLGNVTEINYAKLTDGSNYDRGSGGDIFPVCTYQGPLNVVKSVLYNNGDNSSQAYSYKGLKIHRQGKGFLCFEKTSVTENNTGITDEDNYGYNTTWFSPELLSTTKRSGNNSMSVVTNGYSYKSFGTTVGNKRFFPFISSSSEQNVLTAQTISSSFNYDDYENIIYTQKNFGNRTETTTNTVENIDNSTQWLLGRVTNSSTTFSGTGSPITKQAGRTYSPTSNLIATETYFPSTSSELQKSYEYNTSGTLKNETITGDGVSRVTQYEYEADNIHIKRITDPLGHTSNRAYNNFGWLQSETDYLNNTINYGYDNFGRQNSQTNSDSNQSTSSLQWFTGGEPANARYYLQKTSNDGSLSKTWYDKVGREIRSDVKGFNGNMIAVLKTYNTKGELTSVSEPYYDGSSPTQNTTYTYDDYGRPTDISRFTDSSTAYNYTNNTVRETTNGRTSTKTYNADGNVAESTDPGGTLTYSYYADGKASSIARGGLTLASMTYDAAGNQTQLNDNSAGTINSTYTKFGELKTQTNARGNLTTYNYYSDGRIDNRVTVEGTTTYTYNDNKQLTNVTSPGSIIRAQTYDANGRIQTITENVDGVNYPTNFAYDNLGRLDTRTHPSGIIEKNNYNTNGYLNQIQADGQAVWTINTMDERQRVRTASYGSNAALNATFNFDIYGLPSSTVVGNLQNYSYSFDPIRDNLSWRKNEKNGLQENFEYDSNLNRLTNIYRGNTLYHHFAYDDATGNITSKTDAGTYVYNNTAMPYRLSKITDAPLAYAKNQNIGYTSFEKVSTIAEDANTYTADFVYNADYERAKMTVRNSGTTFLTRTYIGSRFMKEVFNGVEKDYTFVGGDAYSAPVVIERSGTIKTPYFLLRDYLGNITHIANNNGSLKVEYSFDAWGRQRNPSNWTNYDVGSEPDLYMGRGFTGHEHLPWFNLVNMNGRLYDPVVGRMLSPDPKVQMPDYTQSFNRYAYCINNPLAYTDPTGYSLIGRFFRWAKKGFDNLGDWATKNHISIGIGYTTNTSNPWGGVPYAYTTTPNGTNVGVGYNMSTGNVGIGQNSGGFTNFWYPGQNYSNAEQVTGNAIADARARGQNGGSETMVLNADSWRTQLPNMSACFVTCQLMIGRNVPNRINIGFDNGKNSFIILPNYQQGVDKLNSELGNGNPVVVGVHNRYTNSNKGYADHYIVLVGYGSDDNGAYYRYFDPGTQYRYKGTSEQNRLYLQLGIISGNGINGRNYTISQIRY